MGGLQGDSGGLGELVRGFLGEGASAGNAPSPRPSSARGEGAWAVMLVMAYIYSTIGWMAAVGKGVVSEDSPEPGANPAASGL